MTGSPFPRPYYGEWESCDGHFEAAVNVTPGDDVWPTMVGFELSYGATVIGGTLTTDDARDLANHMLAAASLADLENRERLALRAGSPRGATCEACGNSGATYRPNGAEDDGADLCDSCFAELVAALARSPRGEEGALDASTVGPPSSPDGAPPNDTDLGATADAVAVGKAPSPLDWFRGPIVHELKCSPIYFVSVIDGTKTFEVRYDDRGFRRGDELWLREFSPTEGYTGREHRTTITYVFSGMDVNGVKHAYKVLGLAAATDTEPARQATPASDGLGAPEETQP